MRVYLELAYDGTLYSGWQVQPNAITVQECLNDAVSDLFGCEILTQGASRTDAGVHARCNVACFDVDTRMPAEKISYALNQRLPEDIVVQRSMEVSADFHPRYGAKEKTYAYRILNRRFPDPLLSRYTTFFHQELDHEKMNRAGKCLIGQHDFTSFASVKSQTDSFVREIYDLAVSRDEGDVVTILVRGNGFLYNMVRIIAGTLLQVGCGLKEEEDVPKILSALDREQAGPTAPPQGLTLESIRYPGLELPQ